MSRHIVISDEAIESLADRKLLKMQTELDWVEEALQEPYSGDTMADFAMSLIAESDMNKRLLIAERMANHIESGVNTYLECRSYEQAEQELKEIADDRLIEHEPDGELIGAYT